MRMNEGGLNNRWFMSLWTVSRFNDCYRTTIRDGVDEQFPILIRPVSLPTQPMVKRSQVARSVADQQDHFSCVRGVKLIYYPINRRFGDSGDEGNINFQMVGQRSYRVQVAAKVRAVYRRYLQILNSSYQRFCTLTALFRNIEKIISFCMTNQDYGGDGPACRCFLGIRIPNAI